MIPVEYFALGLLFFAMVFVIFMTIFENKFGKEVEKLKEDVRHNTTYLYNHIINTSNFSNELCDYLNVETKTTPEKTELVKRRKKSQ